MPYSLKKKSCDAVARATVPPPHRSRGEKANRWRERENDNMTPCFCNRASTPYIFSWVGGVKHQKFQVGGVDFFRWSTPKHTLAIAEKILHSRLLVFSMNKSDTKMVEGMRIVPKVVVHCAHLDRYQRCVINQCKKSRYGLFRTDDYAPRSDLQSFATGSSSILYASLLLWEGKTQFLCVFLTFLFIIYREDISYSHFVKCKHEHCFIYS